MSIFGAMVKFVSGTLLGVMGVQVSKIAMEIGDIVKSNQAVHQLTDPYGNILVREIANRFPLIAMGLYVIGALFLIWFGMDLYYFLNKDEKVNKFSYEDLI